MRRSPSIFLLPLILTSAPVVSQEQGQYFGTKRYEPTALPVPEETIPLLPRPVLAEHPLWIETYWKAWELAFRNFHEPADGSGFVSQFIDAAFNANIFLWDTAFMSMFTSVAHPLVPGIGSLDNFYARQHPDGEICREINRATGKDFREWVNHERLPLFSRWGYRGGFRAQNVPVRYVGREAPRPNPVLTLDALNNPILSWAEMESFRMTGDTARLRAVLPPLVRYYRALQTYLRQGNGLYVTDWASMDNSPRNVYLEGGGTGVDISSQMAMFARDLAAIQRALGDTSEGARFDAEADSLAGRINALMWDEGRRFYVDLTVDGAPVPVRTIGAYWTMLAGVATPERARELAGALRDPVRFGRPHPVPTIPADEPAYVPIGGYWRGAVWAATNMMVVRALERYGEGELAREIALRHVDAVARVYRTTGTIWENYAAEAFEPGRHADSTLVVRDMVGWSGLGPILFLLEYGIGLKPDAPENRLLWDLRSPLEVGCRRYRFAGHVMDLIAPAAAPDAPRVLSIRTDGPFTLEVLTAGVSRAFEVPAGESTLRLDAE